MSTIFQFIVVSLKNPWVIFGLFAQLIFFFRFFVQWIASERAGRVIIPIVFWYLSIIGAVMIFIYSVYRQDIVFIFSSFLSFFIYTRNIFLHLKGNSVVEAQQESM